LVETVQSLAYKTDLAILAFQGRVEHRPEYLVAESPNNPGYFWGNLLVMKSPPRKGDYPKWARIFRDEFSHQPLIKHMTFGWDSVSGEVGETDDFIKEGFLVEKSVVLTATAPDLSAPKNHCPGLVVRPIDSDDDWAAAILNQVECRNDEFKIEKYLPFKRTQMKKYRDMAEAGLGKWFGAFLNGKLVAECGVFVFDGVGRYQAVGTHPDYRRRGICGNLIFESASWAFAHGSAKTLVMVADPDYHAAKVYESAGFKPTEKAIGVYRFPKDEWTATDEQ
jgi:GNAT superfamily N-acetyltransferase